MWLCRKYLSDMIKDKPSYDMYISTRVDYKLHEPIDYSSLIGKGLIIPNIRKNYKGVQDIIAMGNHKEIMEYLSVYDKLPEIWSKYNIEAEANLKQAIKTYHHPRLKGQLNVCATLMKSSQKK